MCPLGVTACLLTPTMEFGSWFILVLKFSEEFFSLIPDTLLLKIYIFWTSLGGGEAEISFFHSFWIWGVKYMHFLKIKTPHQINAYVLCILMLLRIENYTVWLIYGNIPNCSPLSSVGLGDCSALTQSLIFFLWDIGTHNSSIYIKYLYTIFHLKSQSGVH